MKKVQTHPRATMSVETMTTIDDECANSEYVVVEAMNNVGHRDITLPELFETCFWIFEWIFNSRGYHLMHSETSSNLCCRQFLIIVQRIQFVSSNQIVFDLVVCCVLAYMYAFWQPDNIQQASSFWSGMNASQICKIICRNCVGKLARNLLIENWLVFPFMYRTNHRLVSRFIAGYLVMFVVFGCEMWVVFFRSLFRIFLPLGDISNDFHKPRQTAILNRKSKRSKSKIQFNSFGTPSTNRIKFGSENSKTFKNNEWMLMQTNRALFAWHFT